MKWGGKWGNLWGSGGTVLGSWEQAVVEDAKDDTLFLGKSETGTISELVVDQSQVEVDGTAGTSWWYFAAGSESSPFGREQPKTITARVALTDSSAFTICKKTGSGALEELELDVYDDAGTTKLRASLGGGGYVGELAIPGLTTSARDVLVVWSSRDNIDASGALDAVAHRLAAYNFYTEEIEVVDWFSDSGQTFDSSPFVWGAQDAAGTNAAPAGTFKVARYSARFHPLVEEREDFVQRSAAHSSEFDVDVQALPVTRASGIGDEGEWHGPEIVLAAQAQNRIIRRTVSPFPNERFRVESPVKTTTFADNPDWLRAPGSSIYRINQAWFFPVPVPPAVDRMWVAVNVLATYSSGGPVPVGFRVYSMNKDLGRLPLANVGATGQALEKYWEEEKINAIDLRSPGASTRGQWIIRQALKLAKDDEGWSYITIAMAIDPDSETTDDANVTVTVHAIVSAFGRSEQSAGGSNFDLVEDLLAP